MTNFRVAVLISGNGSNLQAMIEEFESSELVDICCVISNKREAYGLKRASNANIDNYFIDHNQYDTRQEFEEKIILTLDKHNPDLVVLAGFMRILSNVLVSKYSGKLLNIHPSLLPKYKGLNTHKRVLQNKEKYSGCTVHYVNSRLDSGKIILQAKVKISKKDTSSSLKKKILKQEHLLYRKAINKVFSSL